MPQHFLLSAKAKTLSLTTVFRMSDDEAYAQFKAIRWFATGGYPVCPHCECDAIYEISTRKRYKCQACFRQFSVTSGTIFASRKLPIRDLLAAIAIFVNGAKGHSALHLSRDLGVQYKTAFVLAHKLREAMASSIDRSQLCGAVEVDGAYYGGYVKPFNQKVSRRDRRKREQQSGKRRAVVVIRERGGRSLTVVSESESKALPFVRSAIHPEATVYADEASAWDRLHRTHDVRRINHSERYAEGDISTNHAESFHSRMRRAEQGIYHHVSGYQNAYAQEMNWREDNRRIPNGEQFEKVTKAALCHPKSNAWRGYWQRRKAVEALA